MGSPLVWLGIAAGVAALGALAWWLSSGPRRVDHRQAQEQFAVERARLQKQFFDVAGASGKPRGLRWTNCQWSELIEWVRDKQTGQLHALVGVTISFEAIEGGDMEGIEAVGNLRNASAVFFFQDGQWSTVGRVIFNLNPDEAVVHFQGGYERVDGKL